MINLSFENIRSYDGSKNSGFEELVCQLAHLQRPNSGLRFVRKEGAGGDAGVECYWIHTDGSERCWQAKYFLNSMNPSRWAQLDKSFKTALNKHPKMTAYVVSLPIDKSDSRRVGKGGKQVISLEDKWLKRVDKWTKAAKMKGRNIEFLFWGKHEILTFLAIDDRRYSGKALFWFDEPILGTHAFRKIANKSRISLGERFTQEFHVELPIANIFNGLCLTENWWEELNRRELELGNDKVRFFLAVEKEPALANSNDANLIEGAYIGLGQNFLDSSGDSFDSQYQELVEHSQALHKITNSFHNVLYSDPVLRRKEFSSVIKTLETFISSIDKLHNFLLNYAAKSAVTKASLVYGAAGIGKSHLLCDLSLNRVGRNLPTVFLLGQQYRGGNPIELIKTSLDLEHYRDQQVLGALDAAGEAAGSRTLIIIDGINEGQHRDDWSNHIRALLYELSHYKNIALLLSCRTTYLDYILPETINETCLTNIQHHGFKSYEHRAAEKYLSLQGISKPSAPILSPEFTNPLFLKTCCKALKSDNRTTFPKGLKGISSLFKFYIESIEKTIARYKGYHPSERIIHPILDNLAAQLFPFKLSGIPKGEARKLINQDDPTPQKGDSLFDQLLQEGILAEDISYEPNDRGSPVIRFTYERFSDHFIAQHLIQQYNSDNIDTIFCKGQPLGDIIAKMGISRIAGILEALSVALAERYNLELVNLLPKNVLIPKYQTDRIFINSIIWRNIASFSPDTYSIFREIESYGDMDSRMEIFLKLSTEPNHPWNANRLHKLLVTQELAKRDNFWSVKLAFSDSSEEIHENESIVRTLIEWSHSAILDDVEEEIIRLTAITLLWFLTIPNRYIRDRATKSLVRILSRQSQLMPMLIRQFHSVNDLYLVERLYAVAYGVICNTRSTKIISEIANTVYELVFKNGRPIPHILLRDYARGTMEFAFIKGMIPEVDPSSFRPPYSSDWPLYSPSPEEIDELFEGTYSSKIQHSLMGLVNDFGKYTMGCIHQWSPTPLSRPRPETWSELKERFCEELVQAGVKLDLENPDSELKDQLNHEQKEKLRWINGRYDTGSAAFSRKWAQRWVFKRAHELGWSKQLFSNYENMIPHGRGRGSRERIGKKYQWIAFHELLARLSDNVHWIGHRYGSPEDLKYQGPWQMNERNIDPTIWIRKNGEHRSYHNKQNTWWQPYSFPFANRTELKEQQALLIDEKIIPDFSNILQVGRSSDNKQWTVLKGYWSQIQEKPQGQGITQELDAWFEIKAIFVPRGSYKNLKTKLKDQSLIDPDIVEIDSNGHQGFFGEYPLDSAYQPSSGWYEPHNGSHELLQIKYFRPVSKYAWESNANDRSLDENLSIYLPAKELIDDLKLSKQMENFGTWENDDGPVFLDPSIEEYGPSYGLISTSKLTTWLAKNELEIIWLVGGGKRLISSDFAFHGEQTFNGLYKLKDGKPAGKLRFQWEKPHVKT